MGLPGYLEPQRASGLRTARRSGTDCAPYFYGNDLGEGARGNQGQVPGIYYRVASGEAASDCACKPFVTDIPSLFVFQRGLLSCLLSHRPQKRARSREAAQSRDACLTGELYRSTQAQGSFLPSSKRPRLFYQDASFQYLRRLKFFSTTMIINGAEDFERRYLHI